MRKVCALLLLGAAALAPAAFASTHHVTVTLHTSAVKVLYGHRVTLSGRVAGKPKGAAVTLFAWRHGASAPVRLAVTHTRAGGDFRFRVFPARQTTYQVTDAPVYSHKVRVGVEPALSLKELADGRISAHVAPAKAMAGRWVEIERLEGGAWRVVHKSKLATTGTTTFGPYGPSSANMLRLAMSVNQAGAGYLGANSHPLAYHALALTFSPDAYSILYGHSTVLRGHLWNGQAGQVVKIEAWTFKHSTPVTLAQVTTKANGAWSYRVAPRVQTSYQARTALQKSPRERVGVAPAITIRRLAGHQVSTHVAAGKSLAGHTVIVQRQISPGVWVKIGQGSLNRNSSAIFDLTLPASTIRVAMSVNEAGPGYLAAHSRALVYRP
jgi:hypothetical protein